MITSPVNPTLFSQFRAKSEGKKGKKQKKKIYIRANEELLMLSWLNKFWRDVLMVVFYLAKF